jgi:uracil-DNA glycosylase family 4
MEPTGEGLERVLVVGEAPGAQEDLEGVQLVGKSGKRLRRELRALGWDLDRDCWKTNAAICRPPGNQIKSTHIESCRPNLNKAIEDLKPEVILLLGGSAVESLIGQDWQKDLGPLGRWVGWQIPSQRINAWICPTYHPSYLERKNDPVLDLCFRKHLEAALALEGRPWKEVPDWESSVDCFYEPEKAATMIRCFIGDSPVAFDYETDRIKPDHPDSWIRTCSLSDGKVTIAYPFDGEAMEATSEFLKSPTPKIGWNLKFEQRWSEKVLKHRVRDWFWDGMIASHVLDNRPGITSAKFQAFAKLGLSSYESAVLPFLKAVGNQQGKNTPNRIRECDLETLLVYNGLDSLVEYKLAELQGKEMGLTWMNESESV